MFPELWMGDGERDCGNQSGARWWLTYSLRQPTTSSTATLINSPPTAEEEASTQNLQPHPLSPGIWGRTPRLGTDDFIEGRLCLFASPAGLLWGAEDCFPALNYPEKAQYCMVLVTGEQSLSKATALFMGAPCTCLFNLSAHHGIALSNF